MNEQEREAYVRAALALQGHAPDAARIAEIVRQFERIEAIAAVMLAVDLPADAEPAPAFRP